MEGQPGKSNIQIIDIPRRENIEKRRRLPTHNLGNKSFQTEKMQD